MQPLKRSPFGGVGATSVFYGQLDVPRRVTQPSTPAAGHAARCTSTTKAAVAGSSRTPKSYRRTRVSQVQLATFQKKNQTSSEVGTSSRPLPAETPASTTQETALRASVCRHCPAAKAKKGEKEKRTISLPSFYLATQPLEHLAAEPPHS